jgi:WD40 repeat protein
MDGSIKLFQYGSEIGGLQVHMLIPSLELKAKKYIKGISWSPTKPILAAASADGSVIVFMVSSPKESAQVSVEVIQSLHPSGIPESLCFSSDGSKLFCYVRDTPYLSCFDLEKDYQLTKINLNKGSEASVGGFEDHASFAVLDMAVSPNGRFLALATDKSRNIILDVTNGKQIRNLYGHTNDGYSNPKIAWSRNGQYLYGNTQEDGSCCIWDIASSSIVKRISGHASPIRGLYSSNLSETLVSTSFDRKTNIWLESL